MEQSLFSARNNKSIVPRIFPPFLTDLDRLDGTIAVICLIVPVLFRYCSSYCSDMNIYNISIYYIYYYPYGTMEQ